MATKTKSKTSSGRKTTKAKTRPASSTIQHTASLETSRRTQMNKGMSGASPKPKPVAKPAGGTKTGGGKAAGGKGGKGC